MSINFGNNWNQYSQYSSGMYGNSSGYGMQGFGGQGFGIQGGMQGGMQPPPLEEIFAQMDADGSGGIALSEFTPPQGPFAQQQGVSSKMQAEIFAKVDTDGDGIISSEEFLAAPPPPPPPPQQQQGTNGYGFGSGQNFFGNSNYGNGSFNFGNGQNYWA